MATVSRPMQHRKKIGILGGSFNPAHVGHLEISKTALSILNLDEVWWVVTPLNPLKKIEDIAPIKERIIFAHSLCKGENITIVDIESTLGSCYTYDVLTHIKQAYSNIDFVWLMGADSFANFDQWYKWQDIGHIMPLAVLNRPNFKHNALQGVASCAMKASRIDTVDSLFDSPLPKWIYIDTTHNPQSATSIRNEIDGDWWKK